MHELGHVFGIGHLGGSMGITATIAPFFDETWDRLPRPRERFQVRSHYRGDASPGLNPCVGWPGSGVYEVSYWDVAVDETQHKARVERNDGSGWEPWATWTAPPADNGPDIGQYNGWAKYWHATPVIWTKSVSGSTAGNWRVIAEVWGGPGGSDQPTTSAPVVTSPVVSPSGAITPCLVPPATQYRVGSGPYRIKVSWRDSNHQASQYRIYRSRINLDGGDIAPPGIDEDWELVGTRSGAAGIGGMELTINLPTNTDSWQWFCFMVSSVVNGAESPFSAISCAPAGEVQPGGSNYLEAEP
mgnify:CR=1 FL=1